MIILQVLDSIHNGHILSHFIFDLLTIVIPIELTV